jgi:hypothetical protein
MRRQLAIAPMLSMVVLIASLPTQAEGPSLAETLQWMDNTYNRHGGSLGHGHWETYSVGKLFQRRDTQFIYDGCRMTVSVSGGILVENYQDSSKNIFNLSDVDPSSIHTRAYSSQTAGIACDAFPSLGMTCDLAEMIFETRNKVPRIDSEHHHIYPELKGADHESHSSDRTNESSILFDDVNYAARFQNAFRHAVVLCGGRPSAF